MTTLSIGKVRTAVVVAAFAIASVSQALHAQGPTKLGTATVPFAFQAGTAHFVPGAYSISTRPDDLLLIRGASKSAVAMAMRNVGRERSTVSQLVFRRYGNRYFLREVWTEGSIDHLSCLESKAERQAERSQLAANDASIAAHTNIEVALLENPR